MLDTAARPRRLLCALLTAVVGAAAVLTLSVTAAKPASAATPAQNAASAVSYAQAHGYRQAIAIMDNHTGQIWGAGDYTARYNTQSVIKVMIATRLLLTGQMTSSVQPVAYKMITQSDDSSATSLYGRVGGDGLIDWIKVYYNLPDLGTRPPRAGWWGLTGINAKGLARFYNKVSHDPKVWPWLGNAMAHATQYGSDGRYQYFGIPSATTGFKVKQGWGLTVSGSTPSFNSTGFVNGDRYIVVVLTEGPGYGDPIANMVTHSARMIMPGGQIISPLPVGGIKASSSGSTVSVRGWAYDPDNKGYSINVRIRIDGRIVKLVTANKPRADINHAYKLTGGHAFTYSTQIGNGRHRICVDAINIKNGNSNPSIGCNTVTVDGLPIGGISAVNASSTSIAVRGWTFDPDTPSRQLTVYIKANGSLAATTTTNQPRGDINAHYGITGNHGFLLSFLKARGVYSVCVQAKNEGYALSSNARLGCRTLTVTG